MAQQANTQVQVTSKSTTLSDFLCINKLSTHFQLATKSSDYLSVNLKLPTHVYMLVTLSVLWTMFMLWFNRITCNCLPLFRIHWRIYFAFFGGWIPYNTKNQVIITIQKLSSKHSIILCKILYIASYIRILCHKYKYRHLNRPWIVNFLILNEPGSSLHCCNGIAIPPLSFLYYFLKFHCVSDNDIHNSQFHIIIIVDKWVHLA